MLNFSSFVENHEDECLFIISVYFVVVVCHKWWAHHPVQASARY